MGESMKNERITQYRLKKAQKELEEHFDRRNEYILDKIFQGNVIILGPEDLIKRLIEVNNIQMEVMRFEDQLTGYAFNNTEEFHTLYFAEKNEDLRRFLVESSGRQDINIGIIAGFSIFHNRNASEYGISSYDLKDEEFNRDSVKKVIEWVLPKVDRMFNSAVNSSIKEFTDMVMLEHLMNISVENKKKMESLQQLKLGDK
jgi:hypothetical protein